MCLDPGRLMKKRSYNQYCALARALDVVGERWTLLMIREFMIGPRRFSELLENLPGMGTNLLASRLKELEASGLITQFRVEGDRRGKVYQLAERGRELEPVIRGLIQWGVKILGAPKEDELSRGEWDLVAIRMLFRPEGAEGLNGYFVLSADELELVFRVAEQRISLLNVLPAGEKACQIAGSGALLRALLLGEANSEEALDSGQVRVQGSRRQARRFLACFRDPYRPFSAASE